MSNLSVNTKVRCVSALFLLLGSIGAICQTAADGPARGRIRERVIEKLQDDMIDRDTALIEANLPAGVKVEHNVYYGTDRRQCFDVYIPEHAKNAPVIFMVHGGAWIVGDKAMTNVVEKKVARWTPRGFIFISTNYRMLPDADPIEQAGDVVSAMAAAQERAESWGGDRNKFILMGHSAGAHLISLVATSSQLSAKLVKTPWLGAVSLDSAAYDVVKIMENPHLRLYDIAFGNHDRKYWQAASPFYALTKNTKPVLAVCSSRRKDSPEQARLFAEKATSYGNRVTVLEKDFTHAEINARLGADEVYTREVETFLAGLNESVANLLGRKQ